MLLSCRPLNRDLYHIPYRNFTLRWYSGDDVVRSYLSHTGEIQNLTVDGYHFFSYIAIKMPKLSSLTLRDFNVENWDFLYLYTDRLECLQLDNCNISKSASRLDISRFRCLQTIKINTHYQPVVCVKPSSIESLISESRTKGCCYVINLDDKY
jgi:hypothetical protein